MISRSFLVGLTTTGVLLSTPAIVQPALAQRIVGVTPASNSTNVSPNASISGQFDTTNAAAVDVNSVRIVLNGQDITSQSTITPNFFTYRPVQALTPGVNQVRVEYRNTNGEFRSIGWSFTVQQAQPIQITSVTTNAGQAPLSTGATFNITFNGTPGGQASVLLIQDGRTIRELPATESSAGVYRATYTVQASDRVTEGIVLARLRRQTQTTYAAAPQGVAFNVTASTPGGNTGGNTGGNPGNNPGTPGTPGTTGELQPRFTNYQDGGRVGRGDFTLIGQTRPNARVQIRVVAGATVFGVPVGGETVVDQQITADSSGRFQVNVPAPQIPVPGLRYRVRATATEGTQTSPTTEITLRQQ